ncbi:MAG: SRPBCC family protein [Haloarculaceae archaeon]
MDELAVSTLVYLPTEEIYEFLLDFPGYANYSSYLKDVRQVGTGGPGTEYRITVGWWKLSYTARATVTAVEPTERIEWRLTSDFDARGYWEVEPAPDRAPPDRETASRVRLYIRFDPDSAHPGMVDLPALVSLSWVVEKVRPLVAEEAETVVERIVADLEGQRRPVTLHVENGPDTL